MSGRYRPRTEGSHRTGRFLGAAGDQLRRDLPAAKLVDITLLIAGWLSVHRLVNVAGWSTDEWRDWVFEAMQRLVLVPRGNYGALAATF